MRTFFEKVNRARIEKLTRLYDSGKYVKGNSPRRRMARLAGNHGVRNMGIYEVNGLSISMLAKM